MIVKDESEVVGRCIKSAAPLVDSWCVLDTGSTDGTQSIVEDALAGVQGFLHEHEFDGFGQSLNRALALADPDADWILRLDADMTVDAHPDLKAWLDSDLDPETDAWNVLIEDHGLSYRLPLLLRGGREWRYEGATHEWLDAQGRKTRSLLGLAVTHHGDGSNRGDKLERDLALLAPGCAAGEPRAVFYTAETLRFLGRTEEAIRMYKRRAALGGFEEERWYALYQRAKLRENVDELIEAWTLRPQRHEPLQAAADIVARRGSEDILFLSPPGKAF